MYDNEELDNGTVGLQHNTLVCADVAMARYYTEFNVPYVSLIGMLEFLYQEEKISKELYAKVKFRLVDFKCKYIPLQSTDLYFALLENIKSFEILMDSFDNLIDFESLASVLCHFICLLNKNEEIVRDRKYLALEFMFNKIKSLSPDGELLRMLTIELYTYYISLNDILQKYLSNKFYELFKGNIIIFYKSIINNYLRNKKDLTKGEYEQFYMRTANNAPVKLGVQIVEFSKSQLEILSKNSVI